MVKKQLIMEKAIELFASQGFESTSVQQITEHCGISKGAFYLSFKSKDELIIAIIDHFMMKYTTEIDRVVRSADKPEELLSTFYSFAFHSFDKHTNFAKILIKEQSHSFNQEFLLKLHYYDRLLESIITTMIERVYGERINHIKYDLMYCIKAFMSMYSQLFLFYNVPMNVELIVQSLVEKTNLLARESTIPFMTSELYKSVGQLKEEDIPREQLIKMLELKIAEEKAEMVKESLLLLIEQIQEQTLRPAIIKGLIENIRMEPNNQWLAYVLLKYFKFEKC